MATSSWRLRPSRRVQSWELRKFETSPPFWKEKNGEIFRETDTRSGWQSVMVSHLSVQNGLPGKAVFGIVIGRCYTPIASSRYETLFSCDLGSPRAEAPGKERGYVRQHDHGSDA